MLSKVYERELDSLGAFEISADMIKLAQKNDNENTFLNAGRGNPNWINTQGRLAFCRLMEFGIKESKLNLDYANLAGDITEKGIHGRLCEFLAFGDETAVFLKEAIDYCTNQLKMNGDQLVKELVDAVIGNNYPVPSRCLQLIEKIIGKYLEDILYKGSDLSEETDIFPTEGGTAAIVYAFDSLKHNGLINEGDKIAINIPIFTPYLQIPRLTNFDFVPINLTSSEENGWQITKEQLDQLRDPQIKALFLVNPSNPGSHALDHQTLEHIGELVKERKDLMIITDDVYGTFVNGFRSVYEIAPYNTLLVYSYSKLYGVTGWRTGLIAINKKNIFDDLIKKLPDEKKAILDFDYSIVTTNPEKMPFIDRICADSRSIGLYHTSGLSTPQQAFMALLSLTHLVTNEEDPYFAVTNRIIGRRYSKLYHALGLAEDNGVTNSKYYALINIYQLAESKYGEDFAGYFKKEFNSDEFMLKLAQEEGVVLMMGKGFKALPGTLRVSQANLKDEQYELVGYRVLKTLEDFHNLYEKRIV
ncbi:aspartate 4-decarboxylase [Clostridiales Family XIII bacterium PM5-7]